RLPRRPRSPLFPYTTLFRSRKCCASPFGQSTSFRWHDAGADPVPTHHGVVISAAFDTVSAVEPRVGFFGEDTRGGQIVDGADAGEHATRTTLRPFDLASLPVPRELCDGESAGLLAVVDEWLLGQ